MQKKLHVTFCYEGAKGSEGERARVLCKWGKFVYGIYLMAKCVGGVGCNVYTFIRFCSKSFSLVHSLHADNFCSAIHVCKIHLNSISLHLLTHFGGVVHTHYMLHA